MGEFSPPFSEPPSFFFSLFPQILIGSLTLQKFIPHFKILNPRLHLYEKVLNIMVEKNKGEEFGIKLFRNV